MTTNTATDTGNQRWLERRSTFRRPDEQIVTAHHEVVEITREVAKAFVEAHHYSGSFPAARRSFGLHEHGELVGVAVYSHPVRDEVLTNVFPDLPVSQAAELGRFVLLDRVAGNGETWFLSRTFALLREQIRGVVSFSDPIARTTAAGDVVMPGHVGTIYQASNARYAGRGKAEIKLLLPDGTVVNGRSIAKIKAADRGWRPQVATLVSHGAAPLAADACELERRRWLATWLPQLTRPLRHPGNHRYSFRLDGRRAPKVYGPERAYPKRLELAAA